MLDLAAPTGQATYLWRGRCPINVEDLLKDGTILIEKPYDPGQLLRVVRQVLDSPAPARG